MFNIDRLREGLPQEPSPSLPAGAPTAPPAPAETGAAPPEALPEILINTLRCTAKVRYVDLQLDQLDLTLDLDLKGRELGTQRNPEAPWGALAVTGALDVDRSRFMTDLKLDLAPVSNPASLSFDLSGRIMEIDPRIIEELQDRTGIRCAPFGFDPLLHCRENRFEHSAFVLNLRDIRMEDKLVKKLGGMGSIDALRFPVPVKGTLQEPAVDVRRALSKALGGNTGSLLNAFLKGAAAKEMGVDEPPEKLEEGLKSLGNQLFGN